VLLEIYESFRREDAALPDEGDVVVSVVTASTDAAGAAEPATAAPAAAAAAKAAPRRTPARKRPSTAPDAGRAVDPTA
jgi:hypothetical protein